jgi:hypothetical protein
VTENGLRIAWTNPEIMGPTWRFTAAPAVSKVNGDKPLYAN